jgi:hypothetical protein
MNKYAFLAAKLTLGGSLALGFMLAPHGVAHAEPIPVCQYEDGSDVDGQCLWTDPDTGNVYINPTPEEVDASN